MSAPIGVFLAETNSLGVVTGQPVPITTQPFISTLRESAVTAGGSLVPAVPAPTLDLTMVNGATDGAATDSTTSSTSSQSPVLTSTSPSTSPMILASTFPSLPTSTSRPEPATATASSGLTSAAKIGIGDSTTSSTSSQSPVLSSTSPSTSPMISAGTLPSLPTSTSRPGPATATASSGLTSSAKIGIGLGVPLGLLILAILGFLILRHRRHRARSRLKHHGNIAASGPYPAIDEGEMEQKLDSGNTSKVENIDNPENVKDKVHEIYGTEVPAYARELQGSPGVRRHELPTRRGSA